MYWGGAMQARYLRTWKKAKYESRLKPVAFAKNPWGRAPILPDLRRQPTRIGIQHKDKDDLGLDKDATVSPGATTVNSPSRWARSRHLYWGYGGCRTRPIRNYFIWRNYSNRWDYTLTPQEGSCSAHQNFTYKWRALPKIDQCQLNKLRYLNKLSFHLPCCDT